jgi:hypothetical protein
MTLFSLKDAINKQIMPVMLYNNLCNMFADIKKGKITYAKTKIDDDTIANGFSDDIKARQTLDKLDKLDEHIQILQNKQVE